MKTILALCVAWLAVGNGSVVSAVILDTRVSVGLEIEHFDDGTLVSQTDTGKTFASVELAVPASGELMSGMLEMGSVSEEEAHLQFNFFMDGSDQWGSVSMGRIDKGCNFAEITYRAGVDSILTYSWNFEYEGPNVFGLGKIWLTENGTPIAELGDIVGKPRHHEGEAAVNLRAGDDYTFQVLFEPNASSNRLYTNGALTGEFSFAFVPEPATALLLGFGCLAVLKKRR